MLPVVAFASGLQLNWAGGAVNWSTSANTHVTLELSAVGGVSALPATWRLVAVSDTLGFQIVPEDSAVACTDTDALVAGWSAPIAYADSIAHEFAAQLCSAPPSEAETASYRIVLPEQGFGKFKVVALDPDDPLQERVISSNEVTWNGGIGDGYPPIILSARTTHTTATLDVTAIGSDLSGVEKLSVGSADTLWRVPLTITQASDSVVHAVAEVPIKLPAAILTAEAPSGIAIGDVAAEPPVPAVATAASVDTILFRDPNPSVYPHDFAFYYSSVPTLSAEHPWKGVFHLFYIRNFRLTADDSNIAHAWCDSLGAPWQVDTLAFLPRGGTWWDAKKVWAPSIQQVGNLYYMFYTGVDANDDQSIGYATTPVLGTSNINWTRTDTPVFTAAEAGWVDLEGHESPGNIGFRDPFVMPDPLHAGRYLMLMVGEDKDIPGTYAVGVARSVAGTLSSWLTIGKYPSTDFFHLGLERVESPMFVQDSLTGAWRMFIADAKYDNDGHFSTYFLTQSPGDSVTNRAVPAWPQTHVLYAYTGFDVDVVGWQACEHLQIGPVHFFAAYVGPDGIGISRMHWNPVTQKFFFVRPTNVDVPHGQARARLAMYLTEYRPTQDRIRLTVESSAEERPIVAVFDLNGRVVRELAAGGVGEGRRVYDWDCRSTSGERVGAGMYFVRARSGEGSEVLRVAVVR